MDEFLARRQRSSYETFLSCQLPCSETGSEEEFDVSCYWCFCSCLPFHCRTCFWSFRPCSNCQSYFNEASVCVVWRTWYSWRPPAKKHPPVFVPKCRSFTKRTRTIMQATSSDPRMMTVKSSHGKVPLLVKPLKNENQFECNCATCKSLGVCQDTIVVANNLDCLKKYAQGLRKKLRRKRGKKGVNVSAAYNSQRKPSEQLDLKPMKSVKYVVKSVQMF